MNFVNSNLKKAGYVNVALIFVAIALKLFGFVEMPTFVQIESVACIISLLFGLLYSFNGYTKEAADDYKLFMFFYALSCLASVIVTTADIVNGPVRALVYVNAIASLISLVCSIVLTFAKDLGYEKSSFLSVLILGASAITILWHILVGCPLLYSTASFAHLIQSFIVCVFVSAKYTDKQARGSK